MMLISSFSQSLHAGHDVAVRRKRTHISICQRPSQQDLPHTCTHTALLCICLLECIHLVGFSSVHGASAYETMRWWRYYPVDRNSSWHCVGEVGRSGCRCTRTCTHMHMYALCLALSVGVSHYCCYIRICMSPLQLSASHLAGASTSIELNSSSFFLSTDYSSTYREPRSHPEGCDIITHVGNQTVCTIKFVYVWVFTIESITAQLFCFCSCFCFD